MVCIAPHLFLPVYPHVNVGPPATVSPYQCSSHCLPTHPLYPGCLSPTSLNDCFFFNSSVVRLPYSLIFWHFWLFFVFIFGVLLLVVRGGKVYLPTPPSWPEVSQCPTVLPFPGYHRGGIIKHVDLSDWLLSLSK